MYKFTTLDRITRVRPEFKSALDGDRAMVERWNATVTIEDHVWHLGDIGMGPLALGIVKHLNGHKRVILGNHDKFKPQEYLAAGFQKVQGSAYKDGIWLTHIPMHPDGLYGGRINAHGHIHDRNLEDPRYVNVSVEQTNYTPIRLEEVRQRHQRKVTAGVDKQASVG